VVSFIGHTTDSLSSVASFDASPSCSGATLDELTVSVVTPQMRYEMKRNTIRLKDKADAHALKERFGLKD